MTLPFLSEEDFTKALQEIDDAMASRGEKIQGRELRGWMTFCGRYNLEGIGMSDPLSERVFRWFAERYGERLNLDTDFGHSVLLLRGDAVRFRCARFYGRVLEICCPELVQPKFGEIGINRPAISNAVWLLSGVTPSYAASLSKNEREEVLNTVVRAKVLSARIVDAGDQTYLPEARADLGTSVNQIMFSDPQFGLSKWSSLQAVEKFLKAYIAQRGAAFRRVHDVNELADHAESLGLRPLERAVLGLIQCRAEVRYKSSLVTRSDAIQAYQAAVSVCSKVATQLSGQSGWHTGVLSKASLTFEAIMEPVPAILVARTKESVAFDRQLEDVLGLG